MKVRNEKPSEYQISRRNSNTDEEAILAQARDILAKRILKTDFMTNSSQVVLYLIAHLSSANDEHFGVIYLDNQHAVIKTEELFHGTIDGSSVYPRVVARECLMNNAAAVILYHNHPSGQNKPSNDDIIITKRLKICLDLFDIRILDHFIIGAKDAYSFREHGLM